MPFRLLVLSAAVGLLLVAADQDSDRTTASHRSDHENCLTSFVQKDVRLTRSRRSQRKSQEECVQTDTETSLVQEVTPLAKKKAAHTSRTDADKGLDLQAALGSFVRRNQHRQTERNKLTDAEELKLSTADASAADAATDAERLQSALASFIQRNNHRVGSYSLDTDERVDVLPTGEKSSNADISAATSLLEESMQDEAGKANGGSLEAEEVPDGDLIDLGAVQVNEDQMFKVHSRLQERGSGSPEMKPFDIKLQAEQPGI